MDAMTVITTAIVGIIGALVGAGGAAPIISSYLSSRRQTVIDAAEFAKDTFARMNTRIEQLEESEKECLKSKEVLTLELGSLRQEVDGLRKKVNSLRSPLPCASIQADSKGFIIGWSDSAMELYGYSAQEMIGKPITVLMPAYARSAHKQAFESAVNLKEPLRKVRLVPAFAMTKWGNIPVTIVLNSWIENEEMYFDAEIHAVSLESIEMGSQ